MKNKVAITGVWCAVLIGVAVTSYLIYSFYSDHQKFVSNVLIAKDKLITNTDQMPEDLWSSNKKGWSLSQLGRSIYIREGCNKCHSQISNFQTSNVENSFRWGSKRTGPDLANIGGKLNNAELLSLFSATNKDNISEHNRYPWLTRTKLIKNQGTEMDALIAYIQQLKK